MTAHLPRIARTVLAICLCLAGGIAFAEDEFSVDWLDERELEMTRDLTLEIERENSDSVARNVVIQLASSDSAQPASVVPQTAVPAAPDPSFAVDAAGDVPQMQCETDDSGSYACTLRPAR